MYEFNYHKASSIDEAKSLQSGAEEGKFMSGGMTLLPTLKQRLARPSDIIDLAEVPDLAGIEVSGGTVTIKAMTRHAAVAASPEVQKAIPALAKLASGIGDPMVRNRGTIGGSIANSDPAADYPGAVVGLGATIHTDRRTIAGDDFFKDLFETALEEGEMITKVEFPIPDKAGYMKFPNPASRYCIVGVMVSQKGSDIRVGVTGAGACAFRVADMEAALAGSFTPEAVADIKVPDGDLNSDIHASSEYRAHLVTIMAKRAVAEANG
ncbi:MAG: xanthine dehydrogenase family protein subunit M [Rhodospirillaceae bacterium]|jgi:aerobic carbon-monoxide dehydrogenase medium subunit|nr:xanthine dehydrogenase family protein subunit M [Rhodospirillaceae bacterium]MBT5456069.1 xanthine dehydrogenase family protein subunit M [Rhodospirillaceae bacterium]